MKGWPGVAALALALALGAGTQRAEAVDDATAEPLPLPMTIEHVWYRSGKADGRAGSRRKGDLTITDRAVEFAGSERIETLPLETLRVLSYGKMKGDVDTDWAVLAVGEPPATRLVGLRDGRKLGFGQNSREIYVKLRAALRQLAAAQYAAPPGFRTFDEFDDQCTLAVPQDWRVHVGSVVIVGGQVRWGSIAFYPSPSDGSDVAAADTGPVAAPRPDSPLLFIDRSEADRASSCKGISEPAKAQIVERLSRDRGLLLSAELSPATLDGCAAVHLLGVRRDAGAGAEFEGYAAARNDTLFVLGRTAPSDRVEGLRDPFETFVSTFRFSVALP